MPISVDYYNGRTGLRHKRYNSTYPAQAIICIGDWKLKVMGRYDMQRMRGSILYGEDIMRTAVWAPKGRLMEIDPDEPRNLSNIDRIEITTSPWAIGWEMLDYVYKDNKKIPYVLDGNVWRPRKPRDITDALDRVVGYKTMDQMHWILNAQGGWYRHEFRK